MVQWCVGLKSKDEDEMVLLQGVDGTLGRETSFRNIF